MATKPNQNAGKEEQQGQVNQEAPAAETQQQAQQIVVVEKKVGIGTWIKAHWKGLVAGIVGAGAIGGSAVVAYKKGKQAGMNTVPCGEQEDYSLNPNE